MSNFTPLVTRTYDFDGDTVTVVFSRLKRKDMLATMPALSELTKARDSGDKDAEVSAVNGVLNGVADTLGTYVKSIDLKDAEGNPVPIATVVDEMYFTKLCALIAVDLMRESSVTPGNE